MGQTLGRHYDLYAHRDVTPFPPDGPQFDPLYGFEGGRPVKVMPVSDDELASARVPIERRDYCAHLYIKFRKCYREKFPWIVKCEPVLHEYEHCQYKEHVDSYKDYERERRLLLRKKRTEKKKILEEGIIE